MRFCVYIVCAIEQMMEHACNFNELRASLTNIKDVNCHKTVYFGLAKIQKLNQASIIIMIYLEHIISQ